MEYEKVVKFLKIIGCLFMSISVIEIALMISLNFTEFEITVNPILFSEFIYNSSYISLTGIILWLFLIFGMVVFLIIGFFIFKTARSNKIGEKSLSKLIIIMGMVVVMGAFVKMNYLILLGKTRLVTKDGALRLYTVVYHYASVDLPKIIWIYFISVNCFFILSGLVVTSVGIKWTLLIENSKPK
ncbi:MAG: hypothetical protein ACFFCI_06030 [Promethearchaeota archaeon]